MEDERYQHGVDDHDDDEDEREAQSGAGDYGAAFDDPERAGEEDDDDYDADE